ncbi:hypothetical protein GH714_042923 [Hevea brasiliensis]|uniref:SHS2 domain-containing protein n=1 Tax=Hevea brasiliensis TaxID=3981 RepID=A0A6A6K3W1_HEVBR|nr:hypothetical protein GH714_042923 [Hevea brasiliensis]
MTEPRKNVFAVLDMGSTKMVCLAVKVRSDGVPEIMGVGYKAADGVNGGAIASKQHAGYSILSSIDAAEQVSEHTMNQVYVNVSGCNIASHNISNEMRSTVHEISDRDIRRIMLQTYEKFSRDDIVVHNIPIAYHLDDLNDVTELRGLYGRQLRADMHVVTASKLALLNIENCITDNNLSMGAVLRNRTIPLGGMHITRDIAYGLCISVKDAERMKVLHGNVMLTSADKDYAIETEDGNEDKCSVMKSDLTNIIRPRVEEILELVKEEMDRQQNVVGKVVITGGCSNLASIREVASYILNKQVRIGLPVQIHGMGKEYDRNPIFSAAVGTTLLVAHSFYGKGVGEAHNPSYGGRIRRMLKKWITDKSDA